jgi:hypothetical protein
MKKKIITLSAASVLAVFIHLCTGTVSAQADRWKGLVIDETTPEQAIKILGKPAKDENAPLTVLEFQRLLSNAAGLPTFRQLSYGSDPDQPETMLTFSSTGKLVSIWTNPRNTPASVLQEVLGSGWRLSGDDPAADLENWDQPKPVDKPIDVKNDIGYRLLVKTPKVLTLATVIATADNMNGGRTDIAPGKPLWGNALFLLMISRTLERKPGEPESNDGPIPAGTEVVMAPGSSISAETSMGEIKITAGKGLMRSYTWDGATRSVEMGVRKVRWYGSLGLSFPGPGDHWKEHNGITRGVLEEGQMKFKTVAAAIKWIKQRRNTIPLVYRDDGLVVGFDKVPERKQINVEVWQIYINGKKPKTLPGSTNTYIW